MNTTTFANIATELATVAERLRQSTVKVRSGSVGSGSGVIWLSSTLLEGIEEGSLIITNAHVATSKKATVELWDGRIFEAFRTNIDPTKDLAALKIAATDLPTATIGNSDTLRVGELVLAVGNPFALGGAVTTGIIHGTHPRAVMADIALFPGNSGGLLANVKGKVIGINTMIANGLGVAIPSLAVERFLSGNRRQIGVTVQPVLVSRSNSLGALVLSVHSGSAAEAAGLQIGDVLLGVSGRLFDTLNDLTNYLHSTDKSEMLPLQVLRGDREIVCNVMLRGGKTAAEAA